MSDIVDFWRQYDEMEARLSRPLSERMVELARMSEGMHVLDVACGRGEPAIPAARRVGPQGRVLGIDQNEGILQLARENAAREGVGNIEFRVGNAETLDVGPERFDVATVRWALMYMRDPERALQAIHRALRANGTLVIASWVSPEYALLMRRVLSRYREVPAIDSSAPGIFRHADASVLNASLQRCGFTVVTAEELDVPIVEAPDAGGILAWLRALQLLNDLPADQQRACENDLITELEHHHRVGSRVTLGGITRVTVAQPVQVP